MFPSNHNSTPRSSCCYRASLGEDTGFCGECGQALLRCAAFEECGGLLDSQGHCSVCVAPVLVLEEGAGRDVQVGGALALPLTLHNASTVGRPVFVTGLWTREGESDWSPIDLPWDRIEAGEKASLPVTARDLGRAGVHRLEVLLALASRWRWREDVVAFTAALDVSIEGESNVSIQQNIHMAGDAPQNGATIFAPLRFQGGESKRERAGGRASELQLTRAGRLERSLGLRGLEGGPSVPRGVRFAWGAFAEGTAPADGPIVTRDGTLALGRSRTKEQAGPNDVRLLALDPDGTVDVETSQGVSRHHFTLWIENDRPMLRVESRQGGWVSGRSLARGESTPLTDGDTFSPLVGSPDRLALRVEFETHHDTVDLVTLRHTSRQGART